MSARKHKKATLTTRALAACAVALSLAHLGACGGVVDVGTDDSKSNAGSAGSGAVAGGGGNGGLQLGGSSTNPPQAGEPAAGGVAGCVPVACRGQTYACGDCEDNDGDGLIDELDPECLGPCDDDESGLSTGLAVMQSEACRQDCYFDGDAGPGNDQCLWSHACDPLSVPPDYPPSGEVRCAYNASKDPMGINCSALATTQAPSCRATCLPLVPNGCDCFGCCLLPDGQYHYVGRGRGEAGCQLDKLGDLAACPLCTKVDSCYNDCGPCETCVGRQPPASCQAGSGCKPGQRSCGRDAPCDTGDYCVTGCCVQAPKPM